VTAGTGTIHFVIGNPQDEYAGDDDIQLEPYEVTAMKGMTISYIDQERA
jgi:hypothetical protein